MPEQRLRLLIIGGTGVLGINWAAATREMHDVWLTTHRRSIVLRGARTVPFSPRDPSSLDRALDDVQPDVVVHAAGLSNVDDCERDPANALAVNGVLAGRVASAVAARRIRLIHISTDHLFQGTRAMATESDAPDPQNAYARTKLEGERRVAMACPDALIVRTNFFGWSHALRASFSDWVLSALRRRKQLRMFTDVFFTPILAHRLAHVAHAVLDAGAKGVTHLCGDERVSKHAFAQRLATAFDLPGDMIERGLYQEANLVAQRPLDMSLSNARARHIIGHGLGSLDDYFAELRKQEANGLAAELKNAVTE